MIRPFLLVSAFALAVPALAQTTDDMAPPVTEGIAAPAVQDDTAPNLPPGDVPTGTADDEAVATPDHGNMDHSGMAPPTSPATDTMTTTTDATGTPTTIPSPAPIMPSGMGGPMEPAKDYPRCSRTVTDNCQQIGRSGQPL